ncbi:MAG: SusD/RagB family nutrient-binding outer membrane lipoprotein [Gammaproteobacteria bacterium]|nr:SusD/RagB family nutrient-binding outer membrane lipoprotein [Gammaproteobacteria bacterium]
MQRKRSMQVRRVLAAALLAGSLGACEFVDPITVDPNAVPEAALDQLFTGVQVNTWFFGEGQISRLAALWTQQMTGTDRQFTALDTYIFNEQDADSEFEAIYTGGGLVDLKEAKALAAEQGRSAYGAVLKIHEAYLFGMAASLWGDIPYSEAANPEIEKPVLDDQAAVYAAVQSLLSEAIGELGGGGGPGGADLSFGGDAAAWMAAAHTLKARFHLHWAESDNSRYAQAIAEAQQGIQNAAGNWQAVHSSAAFENNVWHQFVRDRSGYISSGDHLLPLMRETADPRLSAYFTEVEGGGYLAPFESGASAASQISETGRGAPDANFPLVTCAENGYILAEAHYMTASEADARTAAQSALACQEAYYGVDLSGAKAAISGLAGEALLEAIMNQKYIAQFLNMDVWNDYKRTCLPAFEPRAGGVPGRLFYGLTERQTNPDNIPEPAQQPDRNDNDPASCS